MKKIIHLLQSTLFIWILSYVLILLLALTASVFIQKKAEQLLNAEVNNTTSIMLTQARNNIDARINDISRIAMQINWNPNVKSFLNDESGRYPADDYNNMCAALRSFQASNSFIESIIVFPTVKNSIVTQRTVVPESLRESFMRCYSLPDGSDLSEFLKEKHYGNLVMLNYRSNMGEEFTRIAFVQSLPHTSQNSITTLMILIDNSTLLSSMNLGGWLNENFVFVLDSNNNILASNAEFDLPPHLSYRSLDLEKEYFKLKIDGEKYLVMQASSGIADWKYVFLLPEQVLMKDVDRATALFRLSIALFLLIGLVVSVIFIRRNYSPLRKLAAVFEKESGILLSRGENEFVFIENAIAAALDKSNIINDMYKEDAGIDASGEAEVLDTNQEGADEEGSEVENVLIADPVDDVAYYFYYPLQIEIQLSNFIKSGNYDDAKKILDDLFKVNFEQNALPQPIIRRFLFNLTSTIMKTIYEISESDQAGLFDNINAVETLLNSHSITDINHKLDLILFDLCSYASDIIKEDDFGPEVKAFVDSNYGDPNLDITMIAGHFAISSSYLSKKFKSGTGVSLLDLINKTRIENAKLMLSNKGARISDIATSCGFINSNTFIRVFKKYEGVTPGSYREFLALHSPGGKSGDDEPLEDK